MRWTLAVLAVLVIAVVSAIVYYADPVTQRGKTVRGTVLVQDRAMVFAGDPSQVVVQNGCETEKLQIGDPVEFWDNGGQVAKGRIVSSFYFPDSPELRESPEQFGCVFQYELRNVPDRELYELRVDGRDLGVIRGDEIELIDMVLPNEEGTPVPLDVYQAPRTRIEFDD